MSTWHVWGDYVHTMPRQIGEAQLEDGEDDAAARTAQDRGFDMERRIRNGFESWAARFYAERDDEVELAFASYPTVRGWQAV